jgi:ferrochelatase
MTKTKKIGVILLNLGGPDNEADITTFLYNLLSDPYVVSLPEFLRKRLAGYIAHKRSPKVLEHYRAIGGKSPIKEHTGAQKQALQDALGNNYVVDFAFRHSLPRVDSVVAKFASQKISRLVALPAYPQWSHSTSGSAIYDLKRAADKHFLDVIEVPSYPAAEGYIQSIAQQTQTMVGEETHVIFCAHGLPQKMIDRGDPYVTQVEKTYQQLTQAIKGLAHFSLAFQSRLGPVKWTGPYLVDEIKRLSINGTRSLVVVPISFICENLETLYELDIEMTNLARSLKIPHFRRVPTPGTHPAFIQALAKLVRQTIKNSSWGVSLNSTTLTRRASPSSIGQPTTGRSGGDTSRG